MPLPAPERQLRRAKCDQGQGLERFGITIAVELSDALHQWEDSLALPARSRQRIDTALDTLLVVFEN